MFARARQFAADVWALAGPYWVSRERWRAWSLLAAIIGMTLGLVYVNVLFSNWNNSFYDALQAHDLHRFWREVGYFCGLAIVFIVIAVYQTYLSQMLQIRWRRWLTDQYLGDWLADHSYLRLQWTEPGADNPDQRIADDLQLFVDATLTLGLGLLSSVVTLVSFASILWRLSGTLNLSVGPSHLAIPGYMLWIGMLYAIGGTWLTHWIGRPLIGLNFRQQQLEANFRFSLVRLRENADAIAFYGGEHQEQRNLGERFSDIVGNWWSIMKRQKRLTWFTAGYSQVAIVFPILAAAPRYFSKALQLGGLMQTAQAFGQVQSALSWFVTAYTQLAQWKATADRLTGFRRKIAAAQATAGGASIDRHVSRKAELSFRNLKLALPQGALLLAIGDVDMAQGEAWLITGPTGGGKSTLLRAAAGFWPYGSGSIAVPRDAGMLFLPQKPYLPVGTLRQVLAYPQAAELFNEDALREALEVCGLPKLAGRLDDSRNWGLELSPGEQQRIAFARALLQRPEWLFLDEATSALDEASEAALYRLIKHSMPNTTLISVGHRSTLNQFHDRRLDIGADHAPGDGQRSPSSAAVGTPKKLVASSALSSDSRLY